MAAGRAPAPRSRRPLQAAPRSVKPPNRSADPTPWQRRQRRPLPKLWLVSGTVFVGLLGYQTAVFAYHVWGTQPAATREDAAIDLNSIYDATADRFDAETASAEFWYGIRRLRKRLVKQALGDVLESAVGTGRNLEYYNAAKIQSLLLVDKSKGMLDICKTKWREQMSGRVWRGKYGFVNADLAGTGVGRSLDHKKFDTIVQTFAVCSTEEPEKLLHNLGSLLKEDGKILLLEHGRSNYDWVNRFLDSRAPARAKKFGCWWNRDIGAIVQKSGLQVVDEKRFTLGTTWWYELKRNPNATYDVEGHVPKTPPTAVAVHTHVSPSVARKSWWAFWSKHIEPAT